MAYAKVELAVDPAALAADPDAARAPGNTVAARVVELVADPPRPVWPEEALADPELALGGRCPPEMRGFGWWPVRETAPALGPLETPGAPEYAIDARARRVDVVRAAVPAPPAALAAYHRDLEEALRLRIDEEAEARRLDFLSPGAGQALAYRAKLAEAEAIGAGAAPDPARHPFVRAEAEALGVDPAARAAEIVAAAGRWAAAGAAIEAARHKARAAVAAARGDAAAMEKAAAVDWAAIGGA